MAWIPTTNFDCITVQCYVIFMNKKKKKKKISLDLYYCYTSRNKMVHYHVYVLRGVPIMRD